MNQEFVPCEIVDGNGNPWRPKVFSKPRAAPLGRPDNWFGGYHVYGFTQEEIDKARIAYDKMNIELVHNGKESLSPFDQDAFMRKSKPSKLSGKPFMLEAAAHQYRDLQQKAGRLNVFVRKLENKWTSKPSISPATHLSARTTE